MAKTSITQDGAVIPFIRSRDYQFIRELGAGACGRTVLLHDGLIDEHFVCKKYTPYSETHREELFANFVREIKILHRLLHRNVVRIFNYYLYPKQHSGFILMEYVAGETLDRYVSAQPSAVDTLFAQAISAFAYLESRGVLHRDIRPANLMVGADGILKVIDLGFGKQVELPADFEKSISLNWWCEPPAEFGQKRYDFGSEVYFVGKLFEQLVLDYELENFSNKDILAKMTKRDPAERIATFAEVERGLKSSRFGELGFSKDDRKVYLAFADALTLHFSSIEAGARYDPDANRVLDRLEAAYRSVLLEETMPTAAPALRSLLNGTFRFKPAGFPVVVLREFVALARSCSDAQLKIILSNLHTRLDAIPRTQASPPPDDDIPF